jgi:putative flippase GtrA
MSDLERSGSRLPRRTREQRAYRLIVAGGVAAAVAVVGFVLAIAGVLGWGIPFIAAVIAVVCGLLFRRAVGR